MSDGIEGIDPPSFAERFQNTICGFQQVLFYLFVLQVVMLVLALFSLVFIDPRSPSYPILLIDLAVIGSLMIVTVGIFYHCNRRDRQW